MRIQTRLILLLSLLTAFALATLLLVNAEDQRRLDLFFNESQRQHAQFLEKLLDLKSASLRTLAFDYTFWDEMVAFARTGDREWARQNIETALTTYDTAAIWVYRLNGAPVYAAPNASRPFDLLRLIGKPAGLFASGPLVRFFLRLPGGLMEIHGATIHPSADQPHRTPARGYFFVGRVWDDAYAQELSQLSGSAIRFLPQGETPGPAVPGVVRFTRPLLDPAGRRVATLVAERTPGILPDLRRRSAEQLAMLLLFAVTILALVSLAMVRWVARPLSLISRTLHTRNPAPLAVLERDRTEFGNLAHLVAAFFQQSEIMKAIAERERAGVELAQAYDRTLEGWSRALDLRDEDTYGHTERVTDATVRLARVLGVPEEDLVHIRRGALLHDIGKMGVPDHILQKPGPLTPEEWTIMRRHPAYAYELLSPIAYLRPALDIPYCHHERWDGTGYPRGLKWDEIPLAARIFAVVDVWDALRSDRPYRRAWSEDRIRGHIRQQAGTHFDPRVVEAFLQIDFAGYARPPAHAGRADVLEAAPTSASRPA